MELKQLGKYTLIEEIGRGGMGAVYHARDEVIGRDVAVKLIAERVLHIPEIRARFFREASSAGRLNHENIVIVHDLGEHDDMPFIVMELLRGTDLRSLIQKKALPSVEQKLSIAAQICSGLACAHAAGVIHRDVKPENIQILEGNRVKILDFGIARLASDVQTVTRSSIGTPRYMSPEQIKGSQVDHRTDIFSFGVVLYEMLTGVNPFTGEHVTEVIYKILHATPPPIELDNPFVSRDLQNVLSRCLSKLPEQRYPDFHVVGADLAVALARQEQAAFGGTGVSMPARAGRTAPTQGIAVVAESKPAAEPRPRSGGKRLPSRPVLTLAAGVLLVSAISGGIYSATRLAGSGMAAPTDTTSAPLLPQADATLAEEDPGVVSRQAAVTPLPQNPVTRESAPGANERRDVPAPAGPDAEDAVKARRQAAQARQIVESLAAQVPPLRAERAVLSAAEQEFNSAAQLAARGSYKGAAESFLEAERQFTKVRIVLESQLTSVKLDVQQARSRALEAQQKASAYRSDSLAAVALGQADVVLEEASKQYAAARYQQAANSFRRAQTLYDRVRPSRPVTAPPEAPARY